MNIKTKTPVPKHWGMAGVFPGELELWRGDEWANRFRFVAEQGFSGGVISVTDLEDAGRRAFLADLAVRHGQVQTVHLSVDYRETVEVTRARLLAEADLLLRVRAEIPLACVGLVVANGGNRFDREFPLGRQLAVLSDAIAPLVSRCRAAGLPVAIENHGDYYISDLVSLCRRTPGLENLLDTGNCFLVGERPDLIANEAFPLIRATHWKDHWLKPNLHTLHFEITGATLGAGHVGLEALFERLCALHPDPANVLMLVEWVPDPARGVLECFEDSKRHLEKLSGGAFTAAKTEVAR